MDHFSKLKPGFAVDIDNVLAEAEPAVQRIFEELTGRAWPEDFYASAGGLDSGTLEPELVAKIFDCFHNQAIPILPPHPGGKRALEWVQGHFRIVIITARNPESRPQTEEWLQRHGIPFDELHFSGDKTDVANHIALAVDDHPEHVQGYCEQGIPVYLMDQPWNRKFSSTLVTRVHSWVAILESLQNQQVRKDPHFSC